MTSPANPVLVSSIWQLHSSDEHKEDANGNVHSNKRKLPIDCTPIDDIFDGGLEYGHIHSITSETENGARELLQALLLSHLTSGPDATASIIDSTLSFDVRKIHRALSASLKPAKDASAESINILKRLQIMQVFDFIGMTECISELRDEPKHERESSALHTVHGTIADSQGEEPLSLASPSSPSLNPGTNESHLGGLLIIDSISQVAMPLLKNHYAGGQALLSSFFRSLAHVTRLRGLCTVVLGAAMFKKKQQHDGPPEHNAKLLSQFASCTLRSMLGDGLGYLVDTQIYLHALPDDSEELSKFAQAKKMKNVLEIVQDRIGRRTGRWVGFEWEAEGRLKGG